MSIFYMPFYYLFYSRLKSKIDQVSWAIIFIVPQFVFSYYYVDTTVENLILLFILSQIVFNTLYEIGYLENDVKTTLKEKNPTKRLSVEAYKFIAKNYSKIIFFRYFVVLGSLVGIYIISQIQNIEINFISFLVLLLINRIFFYLHNINRNHFNLVTFSVLAVTKYIFPIVLLVSFDLIVEISLLLILLFPLIRIIEHSTHKRYSFISYAKLVGNHDKFRVVYYSFILVLFLSLYFLKIINISEIFILFGAYFLAYRIASYILVKKSIYKRDALKSKDLQVKD